MTTTAPEFAITIVANTPPLAAGPAIDVERLADLRRHHEYGCGECATRMSWPPDGDVSSRRQACRHRTDR